MEVRIRKVVLFDSPPVQPSLDRGERASLLRPRLGRSPSSQYGNRPPGLWCRDVGGPCLRGIAVRSCACREPATRQEAYGPPVSSFFVLPRAGLGTMPPADALTDVPVAAENARLTSRIPPEPTHHPGSPLNDTPSAPSSVASMLCNLLPIAGGTNQSSGTGLYIGEGLPPVPPKLAEKIRRWEFVDMSELLPEFWGLPSLSKSEGQSTAQHPPARRSRKVIDLASWIQCFATYVGVLSGSSPEAVPELMAYMIQIVRASQDFGGLAWVNYDLAFRRQATATGNKLWSKVNPSLYSICFAGAARVIKRCDLCLSLTHEARDCALAGEGDHDVGSRLAAIESAVLAFASAGSGATQLPSGRAFRREICRNWNENRCNYAKCRYRHICRVCLGPRPAVECCERLSAAAASRNPPGKPQDRSRPY